MALNTRIDRRGPIPLYLQVITALQEHLEDGSLTPGDQLPGEGELCQLFDVSRTVIRQALKELEYKGLIVREKGKGTFVAEPKILEGLFQELTGFYEDMAARGHPPVSRVLRGEIEPASRKIADVLSLAPETPVIVIVRLRLIEGEPIVLTTSYLPQSCCLNLLETDLTHQSLYAVLQRDYGIQIVRGHRTLEAVPASKVEAELLQVKKGAPLISLHSVSYMANGTPVEYFHALHRGDRSRFEVELLRVPERRSMNELLDSALKQSGRASQWSL